MVGIRKLLLIAFALLAGLLLVAALYSPWREHLQGYLTSPTREVLATAEGDLLNDGQTVMVIKYQDPNGVFVEVVRPGAPGESQILDRYLLPDKRDGLFNFQGHVTRLAIADVDGDGKNELLAPTFDNQLVPHLNVLRFNKDLGRLEPYPAP